MVAQIYNLNILMAKKKDRKCGNLISDISIGSKIWILGHQGMVLF